MVFKYTKVQYIVSNFVPTQSDRLHRMKKIISASRRTDIPAFYLNWFIEKIKAGTISVQNPFYRMNYYDVDLKPENVEWIVFWSRDYAKFIKYRSEFSDYDLFFHFTILSHHPYLERHNIKLNDAIRQAQILVELYGPERIIWRYDPIVIWQDGTKYQSNYLERDFIQLCREFKKLGMNKCYFSIVSPYGKFVKRFNKKYPHLCLAAEFSPFEIQIISRMKEISAANDITLYSCCNDALVDGEILKGSCISGSYLNKITGTKKVSRAKAATRKDCGCTRSTDIGNYLQQTCYFGCIYCYANPVRW